MASWASYLHIAWKAARSQGFHYPRGRIQHQPEGRHQQLQGWEWGKTELVQACVCVCAVTYVNTCKVLDLQAQGQSRTEEEVGKEKHISSLPQPHPIPGTDTWGKWTEAL